MHYSPAFCRSLVLCYIARWQPLRVRLVQGSHFTFWLLWLDRVNHWCPWNIDSALQFITLLDSNIQHVSCWKFRNLDMNWSSFLTLCFLTQFDWSYSLPVIMFNSKEWIAEEAAMSPNSEKVKFEPDHLLGPFLVEFVWSCKWSSLCLR